MANKDLPFTSTGDKYAYTNFALDCKKLTLQEYGLYCALIRHLSDELGYAFPSYDDLMTKLNITSRNTLNNHIQSLIKKGFIIKVKGSKSMNNRYYFVHPSNIDLDAIKDKEKQKGKEFNTFKPY